ncbi:MAG: glycosyltransferase family A protein [Planctomycetota bacterium]
MATSIDVIVPTRGRPEALRRLLQSLATDGGETALRVLIGVDGPDAGERAIAEACGGGARFEVYDAPQSRGPAAVRNRVLERVDADLVLMLNDDVVADAGLIEAHVAAHAGLDRPAMVLGDAPFAPVLDTRFGDASVFDRLIAERSMIFFYDRMRDRATGEPTRPAEHDWGFRHAWTLNLSMPTAEARRIGGFEEALSGAAFEDLEFAYRAGLPVLFRPEARVVHDHRYTPAGYLRRERALGGHAWKLAEVNAECARAVFGRDIRSGDEIDAVRAAVEGLADEAESLAEWFDGLGERGGAGVSDRELDEIWARHRVLKRWCWGRGLLEASESCEPGTAASR